MIDHTLDQISELKLHGLKAALLEQMEQPNQYADMSFEERITYLITREVLDRNNRRVKRMLSVSRMKFKSVFPEDIDYRESRNLKKSAVMSLLQNKWIQQHQNIIITGATGAGKTHLACVFGNQAIISGYSVYYTRIPALIDDIALARAEGSYPRWLKRMAKFNLLILDDFGLSSLSTPQAQELLEIIEERSGNGSHIITSQLPVKEWYSIFKNPTLADAIMDRVIHNAYRLELEGEESMRKLKNRVALSDTLP
ncbi:MAG: IS21-like element helper ATPase IstB [Candidatus Marinimicrobia bacterium]|nr:IS21-like element helper ATPase IstB [Candidatus Neomarinimicrobiota bacterium]